MNESAEGWVSWHYILSPLFLEHPQVHAVCSRWECCVPNITDPHLDAGLGEYLLSSFPGGTVRLGPVPGRWSAAVCPDKRSPAKNSDSISKELRSTPSVSTLPQNSTSCILGIATLHFTMPLWMKLIRSQCDLAEHPCFSLDQSAPPTLGHLSARSH